MLFEFEFVPWINPPSFPFYGQGSPLEIKLHLISHCTVALIARTVAFVGPFLRGFLWGFPWNKWANIKRNFQI